MNIQYTHVCMYVYIYIYLENPPLQKERSQVETQEIIAVESKDRRFTKRLPFRFSSPSFLVAAAPLHGSKLEPALKEMLQGRTKWKIRSKESARCYKML